MNDKKHDKVLSPKVKKVVDAFVDKSSFKVDPNGSWTGRPENEKEKPVQDADDL